MEWIVVDRLEGKIVVCETDKREKKEILKEKLPSNIKEGDVLRVEEDGTIQFDKEETQRRKQKIELLLKNVLKRKK